MNAGNLDKGVARSGVKGPFIVGSISARFYPDGMRHLETLEDKKQANVEDEEIQRTTSIISSYSAPSSACRNPLDAMKLAA
jgi:hypothetical protein